MDMKNIKVIIEVADCGILDYVPQPVYQWWKDYNDNLARNILSDSFSSDN